MAEEEKTEEPTGKRLEKAREEGNVPKSVEISGIISLVVGFGTIFVFYWMTVEHIEKLYRYYHTFFDQELTREVVVNMMVKSLYEISIILMPFVLALLIAGVAGNLAQFGFNFTTKVLVPKFEKLNPISGFKNIISLKKIVEGFQITLKVFVALILGFWIFYTFLKEIPTIALFPLVHQLIWFKDKAIILISSLLILFLVLAIIDLIIKRYQYFSSLKMTKQEIKDEYKQMEGSPEIKRRIRQVMMQASMKRMMQNIPTADVVVTNPTHYAVALRYDTKKERSPRVVAKGVDLLALKIKDIAREHDIQIVENPTLARELYKSVDIDKEIPEALFQAVAEVLAFVHKVSKKFR